jgi:hypothetical protein
MTNRAKMTARQQARYRADFERWEAEKSKRIDDEREIQEYVRRASKLWDQLTPEEREGWQHKGYTPPLWFVRKLAERNPEGK